MNDEELLKNEKIGKVLSPHPLSFMKYQSLCIFLIVWGVLAGWLINFSDYRFMLADNEWYPILVWAAVLVVAGIALVAVLIFAKGKYVYLNVAFNIDGEDNWATFRIKKDHFQRIFLTLSSKSGKDVIEVF